MKKFHYDPPSALLTMHAPTDAAIFKKIRFAGLPAKRLLALYRGYD